jgi:hypothetical protein
VSAVMPCPAEQMLWLWHPWLVLGLDAAALDPLAGLLLWTLSVWYPRQLLCWWMLPLWTPWPVCCCGRFQFGTPVSSCVGGCCLLDTPGFFAPVSTLSRLGACFVWSSGRLSEFLKLQTRLVVCLLVIGHVWQLLAHLPEWRAGGMLTF